MGGRRATADGKWEMAVTVRLKQEGSKGGGDHGVKGHSPFVTFQSGPSGKTSVNVDAVRGPLETKDSRLSYKDKLLCLGESGLLEPHFSAAKALSGWKDYFARSNEKQGSKEIEGEDEGVEQEEEAVDVWRRTGKLPNLQVNAEEYDAWCKPFMNSLIVKLLGKTVNVGFMRFRMERMWAAKGPLRVTPLSNGYFLVSFSSTEDRDHALQEGPWMIADHYVLVQRLIERLHSLRREVLLECASAVTTQSKELGNSSSEAPSVATTAPEKTPIKEVNAMEKSKGNDQGVNYGPEMLVKRELGNNSAKVVVKVTNPEVAINKAEKGPGGINVSKGTRDHGNQRGDVNGNLVGDVEADLRNFGVEVQNKNKNEKQEWIQVGLNARRSKN
ncbi:hypothetical protein K1719_040404 [Acacia pycnantha]|nr:hypothetical protein K1719_040404 [Acacia pycnantha]